jgi:hypothetical protein
VWAAAACLLLFGQSTAEESAPDSGAPSTATPSPSPTPVSYRLTVTTAGSGGGMVTGGNNTIACGQTCTATYPKGAVVDLRGFPDALSLFRGWRSAEGEPIQAQDLVITQDITLTAVFDLAPPDCLPTNGGVEQCGDEIDNDCNGRIDEGCYECRTDFENAQCCKDEVCTPMSECLGGEAAIFLGCDNIACNPMVSCEAPLPEEGPCECEIEGDGIDNDCNGYIDEPADEHCVK